ncbi:DUF4249 family protein [Candidatus Latescibacterota bacterium]
MPSLCGLLTVVCGVTGCSDDNPIAAGPEQLVVSGYVYAGEPVTQVTVAVSLPLDADSTAVPAVNDARVSLARNGRWYDLELAPGDSGLYHYTGADLVPAAGDRVDLEVEYGDLHVTASTRVPPPPRGLSASAHQLVVEADTLFLPGSGMFGGNDEGALTVSWDREDGAYYMATVESIEAGADSVESLFPRPAGFFGSQVMRDSLITIQPRSIRFYGRHEVTVYRATEEYAELSAFRVQNLNDLAEPPSNVEGGLGIFTAFSSASVQFEAVRP